MPTIVSRIATTRDIPELVDVINRAYVAEAPFVHGQRTNLENLRQRMTAANTWFLVVEVQSHDGQTRIAGCVCLDGDGTCGHIGLLSVDPDFQRHGFGRALLRAAEALCRSEMPAAEIELEVVSLRTDLFPFYTHMGYDPVGTAPFPAEALLKQPAHMVVMRRSK